jgi:hypothetical protein
MNKAIPFTILILFTTYVLLADNNASYQTQANYGIGIGSIIAIVASWSRNHSVLWAIIHAFFGWAYVIYFVVTRGSTK